MENINDTLLVTINLSAESPDESTVEVVAYMADHRNVINIFRAEDAELIYKTLINKYLRKEYLAQLPSMSNPSAKPDSDPLAAQKIKEYAEEIQKINEQESADFDITDDLTLNVEPITQLINDGMYFSRQDEANEVLKQLHWYIDAYGYVSLAQYKELLDVSPYMGDHFTGWDSLEAVEVVEDEDNPGVFLITLPEPQTLSISEEEVDDTNFEVAESGMLES